MQIFTDQYNKIKYNIDYDQNFLNSYYEKKE